jgi:diguanylate cyclase (GGDEF)-like protein/PAS domain S-box-containing protein
MPGFSDMNDQPSSCDDLNQQLRLASLALDAASDAIMIHRTDGSLIRFNAAAATQRGCTPEELIALGPWGWAEPMSEERRQERLEHLREQGEISFIARHPRCDGSVMVQDVRTHWVEAPGGPYIVAVSRDVTEMTHAHEVLENLAFHDPLTGIANRALFEDRLEVAISSARRHHDLLGVAFLDLDDFKSINDGFGHGVGDMVLVAVAHRLEGSVRHEDTVARLGGDEFVTIFPRMTSAEDIRHLAEKFVGRVNEPVRVEGLTFDLTASVGVAILEPDDDVRSLLMRADIEMYEAKRASSTSRRGVQRSRR